MKLLIFALVVVIAHGQDSQDTCFARIKGPPRKVKWSICDKKGKIYLNIFIRFGSFIHILLRGWV